MKMCAFFRDPGLEFFIFLMLVEEESQTVMLGFCLFHEEFQIVPDNLCLLQNQEILYDVCVKNLSQLTLHQRN